MTNPTWAGRSAQKPTPEPSQDRAGWLPAAGVVLALGLVGAGGYILGSGGDSVDAAAPTTTSAVGTTASTATTQAPATEATATDTTATETTATDTTASDAEDTSASGDGTTVDADTSTSDAAADDTAAGSDTEDETTTADDRDEADAQQVVIEDGEVRGAVLRNGVLYLGGSVPSREIADQIIDRAAAIVGEENIVDEYVIDPDAELVAGAPLYVDDVVLFAYGERTYDPQFEPLLDLGLALLLQNPSVKVTIVTHTDASGSASYNDRLSYQRGESVAQYWVDRGVPVEQIRIDARGEHDPRADNGTPDGAQLNRRAEFYIEGLLP